MEEKISFISDGFSIEGLFTLKSPENGVVISHPHPLMGGDMNNYIVETIKDAYLKNGYSVLRFNFRGAGRSQGEFDNGDGEKNDTLAAIEFLRNKGIKNIDLAGYSFGSWVNSRVMSGYDGIKRMVMVSPPVDFIDFSPVVSVPSLSLVITGEHDEYASPEKVRGLIDSMNPDAEFIIIDDADHFYGYQVNELKEELTDRLG